MTDIVITSIDLAKGLKAANLDVPPMLAEVVLKNPPAELLKAFKQDKLIAQKLEEATFVSLKKASDALHSAINDLDQSYTNQPPADKREAEARAATFNAMCKKIAEAQASAATDAAEQEWDRQAKKNKDLTRFKVVFGLKLALGTVSVAVSITAAVLSIGTLAVTIIGAAKTVAGMVADVYNFCRDMDKAEHDIIDTDLALARSWSDKEVTKGKVARELAAALGVPFIKSVVSMQALLNEYNAKNARKDHAADELWTKAKKLMATIEAASGQSTGTSQPVLRKLGEAVSKLLDQIHDLSALSKSNDLFYDIYKARCATYKALEGGPLGKTTTATGAVLVLAGIASTANTVVDIALKLA